MLLETILAVSDKMLDKVLTLLDILFLSRTFFVEENYNVIQINPYVSVSR